MSSEKTISQIKNPCIVRSNAEIKSMLSQRIKERDIRYLDLIDYAQKKGITLSKPQISRYFTNSVETNGIPTQEAILCMCECCEIEVQIKVAYKNKKDGKAKL